MSVARRKHQLRVLVAPRFAKENRTLPEVHVPSASTPVFQQHAQGPFETRPDKGGAEPKGAGRMWLGTRGLYPEA